METRHLTVRAAWHDRGWDGSVCEDPRSNTKYCTAPGSLLANRINGRINPELETKFRGRPVSEIVKHGGGYVPPCYWAINAHGSDSCTVSDPHPFIDGPMTSGLFSTVPPLEHQLDPFSVFTWPFAISWEGAKQGSRYAEIGVVQDRINSFVGHLHDGASVVFTYCTPNNPITGDDRRPLLVGAGLVAGTEMPKDYSMSDEFIRHMRSRPMMGHFPRSAWQFKIRLDPECSVALPYQEYLGWCELGRGTDQEAPRRDALRAMSIPVTEENLAPHFKYVSMHVPADKALYLLYLMRRSVERMSADGLIPQVRLDEMTKKIERMLKAAWQERGQYPGIHNAVVSVLQGELPMDKAEEAASLVAGASKTQDGIGDMLNVLAPSHMPSGGQNSAALESARCILQARLEELEFLARLDLTAPQARNILRIINDEGIDGLAGNPYLLLERYAHYGKKSWDSNESDYGLSLYQIDMAMIPDPGHAAWGRRFNARSPARLGAAVAQMLDDNSRETGSTYMTRDEVAMGLEEYPLYYISGTALEVGRKQLEKLEGDPDFTASFAATGDPDDAGVAHYQLNRMRRIEGLVEAFVDKMLGKKYAQQSWAGASLSEHARKSLPDAEVERRKAAYSRALSGGAFALSGKAGSGKTDAIATIIGRLRVEGAEPVYVVTPTGKAALVIKDRLREDGIAVDDKAVVVSTIDHLLYRTVGEHCHTRGHYKTYKDALKNLLDHGLAYLDEFEERAKKVQLGPRALIIDEASMVDQLRMAALLSVVSTASLKYLVVAGDERQLPPIGYGSPFTDIIHHLKGTGREDRHIRLEGNLRFSPDAPLGELAGLFEDDKGPSLAEIRHAIGRAGGGSGSGSLDISYFADASELEAAIAGGLSRIAGRGEGAGGESARGLFGRIIEGGGPGGFALDRVQILSPRRVGEFGTAAINQRVDERWPALKPGAKVMCEKNVYVKAARGSRSHRVLGLANGSMGYIRGDGAAYFRELDDLRRDFDRVDDSEIKRELSRGDAMQSERFEAKLDLGYAITIHKAQGSGFDHVLLVLSDMGRFVSREMLYTALTRARRGLRLLVRSDMRDDLPALLSRAFENSAMAGRKTLMFGPKGPPFKSYRLSTSGGGAIRVRSKSEYIMAKLLDESGTDFEYEPDDLYDESRIRPDFKIAGRFYLEHLGQAGDAGYMARWRQKRAEYRRLGLEDDLVTTSEGAAPDYEGSMRSLIEDVRSGAPRGASGEYSLHHYVL